MRFPNLGLISSAILGLLLAIPGRAAGKDAAADRSKYPTTLQQRLGQIPLAPVQIVGVQFNPTASGIEVILATASGKPIQAKTQPDGKTLIITIDNAVLQLSTGQPLVTKSTSEGIVSISVTQQAGNRVEVRVFGDRSVPTIKVSESVATPTALQNRACDFHRTRLLSKTVVVIKTSLPTYRQSKPNDLAPLVA